MHNSPVQKAAAYFCFTAEKTGSLEKLSNLPKLRNVVTPLWHQSSLSPLGWGLTTVTEKPSSTKA
jgi:hypothetical protein